MGGQKDRRTERQWDMDIGQQKDRGTERLGDMGVG